MSARRKHPKATGFGKDLCRTDGVPADHLEGPPGRENAPAAFLGLANLAPSAPAKAAMSLTRPSHHSQNGVADLNAGWTAK
jgi:hypothetical protein